MVLAVPAVAILFAIILLIGLQKGYEYSLGSLLESIGQWFLRVTFGGPLGIANAAHHIGNGILGLDHLIRRIIGDGIETFKDAWTACWGWCAHIMGETGHVIGDLADETAKTFQTVYRVSVPYLIAGALGPVWTLLRGLHASTTTITRTIPGKIDRVTKLTKVYPVTVERVPGLARQIRVAVAAAVAGLAGTIAIPKIGPLEADITEIKRRLAKASNLIGLGTIVGVVGYALSKLGLGSQQCSNNKRFAKSVCGMSTKVLDDLLAGLIAIVGTVSLVQLAEEYQKLVPGIEAEVVKFWRVNLTGPVVARTFGTTGA